MAMLGDLSEFSLPSIFQMIEKSEKSGQLSIWAPDGVYRIIFYQGRVFSAMRPDTKAYLKSLLIQAGALKENGVRFIRNHPDLLEPLGKLLKRNKIVDSDSLKAAFCEQIQTSIYPLFSLNRGQFRFSTKTPIPYHEMTGLSRSSLEIAIEGIRHSELSRPDDDHLPSPSAHYQRAIAELPLLNLSSLEWSILEKVTPEHPILHLSQSLKADLLEVRRVVRRLSKVALIEATIAPSPKQSSTPTAPQSPVKSEDIERSNRKLISRLTAMLPDLKQL